MQKVNISLNNLSRKITTALQSAPDYAKVSLDGVIKTMWDTAMDMTSKYKLPMEDLQ